MEEGGVFPSKLSDRLVLILSASPSSTASASISSRSSTSATIEAMKSSCSSCSASPTPFPSGVETDTELLRELGVEKDGVSRETELRRDFDEEGVASEFDLDLCADDEPRASAFFLLFSMSFLTQSFVKFLTFDCFSAES